MNKLQRRLALTLEVRNHIAQSKSIEHASQRAVDLALEHVNAQVASVFVFSKVGYLERLALRGVDKAGNPLTNSWFPEERYAPGESFTGRTVLPAHGETPYGLPHWSKNLSRADVNSESREMYARTLGSLATAIAFPLNGMHRSFGVLEVINRIPPPESKRTQFDVEDIYWLSIIGNSLATAISDFRRHYEVHLLRELSMLLLSPFVDTPSRDTALQRVADLMVQPETIYGACILRIRTNEESTLLKASDNASWDGWKQSQFVGGATINERVFRSGNPEYVPDAQDQMHEFRNALWIQINGFKAYACVPLILEGETERRIVGTISLFTRFRHNFMESDKHILQHIAYLVAAVVESFRTIQELRTAREDLARETDHLMGVARSVGFDVGEAELAHTIRNELLEIRSALTKATSEGTAKSHIIITGQIDRISRRLHELKSTLSGMPPAPININLLIKRVVQHFRKNEQGATGIDFQLSLDPSLPIMLGREEEILDIIHNLLSNAVKAIRAVRKKGGCIEVASAEIVDRLPYVEITVADNGAGIRNENIDRIFEPKFTTYTDGTGMGLFLVRRTLDRSYGGDVLIKGTSVGRGTTVAVRIPLRRNQARSYEGSYGA